MDIECEFKSIDLAGVGIRYCCCLIAPNITQKLNVKSFIGQHEPGESNQSVEGLYAYDGVIHFLPTGISKHFPQLVGIYVYNCGLKKISAEDLKKFEHLESLDFQYNELRSLPNNLFMHTKKLKWIDLFGNKLESMSSRVLKPLTGSQLKIFDLRSNTKIDQFYRPGGTGSMRTLDEMKNAIDAAFENSVFEEKMAELKESIWRGFETLWRLKDFSDFTIVVGEKEFPVHKCVLAVQSSVFASMFKTDEDVKTSNMLEIKDCSEDVVEQFICAVYTGEIENENNEQHALDLFSLASTFDVPKLKAVTEIQVVKELNEENAVKALTLGNLYNSEVIIDAAFKKIKEMHPNVMLAEALKHKPEPVEEFIKILKEMVERLNRI